LGNDTAALQNVAVRQTSVTWTRNSTPSFAVPQFDEVPTGEMELAQASPQAASFTLTGLNLPMGQNILIRAHDYYRSRDSDGFLKELKKEKEAWCDSVIPLFELLTFAGQGGCFSIAVLPQLELFYSRNPPHRYFDSSYLCGHIEIYVWYSFRLIRYQS